jgi:hypothetical protein
MALVPLAHQAAGAIAMAIASNDGSYQKRFIYSNVKQL